MAERVLMKGNEAIAEAAIRAGCRHYFGYPITPQTEIAAYMAKKMPKIGGVFLQAESEIASINMVYGAAATGMRVMTSSSSPGISLKAEGLSYIAGSDIPAFVVNVQRGGPGLGGIQPSQSDYFQATKGGGHGDYRMIVLAPASVQEMASLTMKGFELADKYLMTSMILADGTIGQMMEPISFEDAEVETYEKPWALTGTNCERKHIRAGNIAQTLSLQGNSGAGGRSHNTHAGSSCAVNHVDGSDFTFCLQEDTADLGHLLCHVGSDLRLGSDGVTEVVTAAGTDRSFCDGLVALHQYTFSHFLVPPYFSTVMMQSGHMVAQKAQAMHFS